MRQKDSHCFRGPRQQHGILNTTETNILNTNNVQRGIATEQRAENIVVEVFVREPAQHLGSTPRE